MAEKFVELILMVPDPMGFLAMISVFAMIAVMFIPLVIFRLIRGYWPE